MTQQPTCTAQAAGAAAIAPHRPPVVIAVLAHNEERRIGACLASLPIGDPDCAIHVLVNGSSDRTAEVARSVGGGRVTVHDWAEGGKARSWNRFLFDLPDPAAEVFVFVDGDVVVAPGAIARLAEALAANPQANAASGVPLNGRRAAAYQQELLVTRGLFGGLYALSGAFIARLRDAGMRLPLDLVGDDGLIGAMAKTDLADESSWRDSRVEPCLDAGFHCEPTALRSPRTLLNQYRRMISYSTRHFQNRIISAVMRDTGPAGLPVRLAELYPRFLPDFRPRRHPLWWWFDRLALARMRAAGAASPRSR